VTKDAYNVCGYIDNGAATTVVIGAHYDHLGYGHEGSLYRGEPAIHNGADDNASGTAALIELGRDLRIRGPKHNNYLLLAFSGEEKGLLGSNYYVKHPTVDLTKVNYMLNMDMVGRLKKDEPVLILSGTGTSPRWKTLVDSIETDQVEQAPEGIEAALDVADGVGGHRGLAGGAVRIHALPAPGVGAHRVDAIFGFPVEHFSLDWN